MGSITDYIESSQQSVKELYNSILCQLTELKHDVQDDRSAYFTTGSPSSGFFDLKPLQQSSRRQRFNPPQSTRDAFKYREADDGLDDLGDHFPDWEKAETLPRPPPIDTFDSLSLQLRAALPDIRAGCLDPYIQKIARNDSTTVELKVNGATVALHRPDDVKMICVVSGDGVLGRIHRSRSIVLLIRSWLSAILRDLVVLRGICTCVGRAGSMIGPGTYCRGSLKGYLAEALQLLWIRCLKMLKHLSSPQSHIS